MPAEASNADLYKRLTELEREVVNLRRRLRPTPELSSTERIMALTVRVGDDQYAIPIQPIREIVPMVWPKPIPQAPEWVLGTFRYGRQVVPMIDLHRRLAGVRQEPDVTWRIVLTFTPEPTGLIVSAIGDILDVRTRDVVPPAPDIPQAPFLSGALPTAGGEIVYVLSIERLAYELGNEE